MSHEPFSLFHHGVLICLEWFSIIAIILMGKRELVAWLNFSFWCLVMVEWFFLAVPWGCLRFVMWYFLVILTYFFELCHWAWCPGNHKEGGLVTITLAKMAGHNFLLLISFYLCTFIFLKNSKWVWSGNTTSQTADNPHGTARKNGSTTPRHQEDKPSIATSSLFPIKMIAILEWT